MQNGLKTSSMESENYRKRKSEVRKKFSTLTSSHFHGFSFDPEVFLLEIQGNIN